MQIVSEDVAVVAEKRKGYVPNVLWYVKRGRRRYVNTVEKSTHATPENAGGKPIEGVESLELF